MADTIREVQCYMIIDSTQTNMTLPQKLHKVVEMVGEGMEAVPVARQKTVLEAYPNARKSIDESKVVIPIEVGEDETFEEVYTAMKSRFGKTVMGHKETLKALKNSDWIKEAPEEFTEWKN